MAPAALAALAWLVALSGCEDGRGATPTARRGAGEASTFACDAGRCVQRHVRLPDDGEWRCAEREGVVWCAGGEPAAGVVRARAERGYVCGVRRPNRDGRDERVCVDEAPDYPGGAPGAYRCRFLQDRGVQRECVQEPGAVRAVSSRKAPDCWLDADCGSGTCDRGRCERGAP